VSSSRRRTVTIDLVVDDSDKGKLDDVGRTAEQTGSKFQTSFRGIATAAAGAFAVDRVVDFGRELIDTAGTIEATTRKVNTVFGDNADAIREWADDVNESFGKSETEVAGFAAAIGDLLVPMGFTREEAAQLAPVISEAANAFSEFQPDVTTEQAINAVTSALTGEREALKGLGIVIKEEDLKAENLTGTFQGLTGETEQQQKALDTLNLIFQQGKDALDAYEDRAGSLEEKQKDLAATFADFKDDLALGLTPAIQGSLQALIDFVQGAEDTIGPIVDVVQAVRELDEVEGLPDEREAARQLGEDLSFLVDWYNAGVDATESAIDATNRFLGLDRRGIAPKPDEVDAVKDFGAAWREAASADQALLGLVGGIRESTEATEESAAAAEESKARHKELADQIPKTVEKYEDAAAKARDLAAAHMEDVIPAIEDTIDIFETASSEMGPSLDELEQNLDAHITKQEEFWTVVTALYEAGMPELAQRIRDGGPEHLAAGQEILDNMERGLAIEERLAGLGNSWAAFMEGEARAFAASSGPTVFGILQGYGIDMASAVERGFLDGMAGINWDQYFQQIARGAIPAPPGLVGGGGSDVIRNGGPVAE